MSAQQVLEKVKLSFQCPMNWDELEGGEVARFCARCRKEVVDLSVLTQEEGAEFVKSRGGQGACVRLTRRQDGSMVTKGCPRSLAGKVRGLKGGGAVAAAGLALSSCVEGVTADACESSQAVLGEERGVVDSSEEFEVLMGVMCPPEGFSEFAEVSTVVPYTGGSK